MKVNREAGETNPFLIATVFLSVALVGMCVGVGWSYYQMQSAKTDVTSQINDATAQAKSAQEKIDANQYADQEKSVVRSFSGPADFGGVKFDYPKTWADYTDKDGTGNTTEQEYAAYFYPQTVPPIKNKLSKFALRVNISPKTPDNIIKSFDSMVKKGQTKVKKITVGKTPTFSGYDGWRIDGILDDNKENTINGSMVVFQIRQQSLTLQTDSQQFMADFNNTVLKTLRFEP